jgi:hypothetical protein
MDPVIDPVSVGRFLGVETTRPGDEERLRSKVGEIVTSKDDSDLRR